MPLLEDMRLLREYAEQGSESAFEEIVKRHVNLVHSTALRKTRDPHLADEVTQTTFVILARKARSLGDEIILSGWLYRTTLYTAYRALRTEARRREREREAALMNTEESEPNWEQLSPVIDQAMARLGAIDRDAIILRYFENKSSRQVAEQLGINEAAAQKRIVRAVEKLRGLCGKRGVVLPAVALVALLSANAVQAAPLGTVSATTAAVAVSGTGASTTALAKGTLKLIAWAKYKLAVYASLSALTVGGVALVVSQQDWFQPKYEGRSISSWLAQLDDGNRDLTPVLHWKPWGQEVHATPAGMESIWAIRSIGPEALPRLLADLKEGDPTKLPWFGHTSQSAIATRREALLALDGLGPDCRPLIPELTKMLYNNHNPKEAAAVLGAIGPEGWKVLSDAIPSTNETASVCSIWALGSRKAAVPGTVEAMESLFKDTPLTGTAALDGWALVEIGQDRERVLDLLISGLSFKRSDSRWGCAVALGHMGREAAKAVPSLVAMLGNEDGKIRHDAAQALEQIAPEVAAREGVTGALATEHVPSGTF